MATPYVSAARVPEAGYPVELEVVRRDGARLYFELDSPLRLWANIRAALATPGFERYRVNTLDGAS